MTTDTKMTETPSYRLGMLLREIEKADKDYERRYGLVIKAMALATELCMKVGIGFDPNDPEWPVVYIELPHGQVSWHMTIYSTPWDGHTTAQKYQRCHSYTHHVTDTCQGCGRSLSSTHLDYACVCGLDDGAIQEWYEDQVESERQEREESGPGW